MTRRSSMARPGWRIAGIVRSLALVACASGCDLVLPYGPPRADGGADRSARDSLARDAARDRRAADADGPRRDAPLTADVRTPDGPKPKPDGLKPDTLGSPCAKAVIGVPCMAMADCTKVGGAGATCLVLDPPQGVCGCGCTPDDPMTTLVNEDSCPDLTKHLCVPVGTAAYCMQRCTPSVGSNSCLAPLACWPEGAELTNSPTTAVCAFAGCSARPGRCAEVGKPCSALTPCTAGQLCRQPFPTATKGWCVGQDHCDAVSGLCAPRPSSGAKKIGDPCTLDLDCAAAAYCEREVDHLAFGYKAGGQPCMSQAECCSGVCSGGSCTSYPCLVSARNGYCRSHGCSFAASLPTAACPAASTCSLLYGAAGYCMKTCDPQISDTCRGLTGDLYGDYECRPWNQLKHISGKPMATAPVCDFGEAVSCVYMAKFGLSCLSLGLPANPTQMLCRTLDSKPAAATNISAFCLDNTSSGLQFRSPLP